MVAQLLIVYKIPLATGIFVAPTISFAREINPFRMAKLVTHKVEVSAINGAGCKQTNHLMKRYTTVYITGFITLLKIQRSQVQPKM